MLSQDIPDTHPLLLENLTKAQTSPQTYLNGTVSVVEGFGLKGAKPRPYRGELAVKFFGSWAGAAAMLNAHAFASIPLRLYVRKKGGRKLYRTRKPKHSVKSYLMGDGRQRPSNRVLAKTAEFGSDFEEVTEPHPALKVLADANPWMNGYELSTLRMLYLQFTGNAYVTPVIDAATGIPVELWPLPSQWVQIIPSRENFISGYLYGRKPNVQQFAPDEVIQWKLPNLDDVFYGRGKAELAWTALGLHQAKRTEDTARHENASRPDWMLIVKSANGATGESLSRLETKIETQLKGSRNRGNFLSVTGDIEAVPLNFDQVEIGDPDKVVSELAAVFGVPLYKLLGNDPIKANSEIQDTGWLRDTILPYCRLDEEQLNARYLPLFDVGEDAFLAYDNPVPDDKVAETDAATKRVAGSLWTVNEGRQAIGDEPIEGGDVLLVPSAMTTLERTVNPPEPADPFGGLFRGNGKPEEDDVGKRLDRLTSVVEGLVKAIGGSNEAMDRQEANAAAAKGVAAQPKQNGGGMEGEGGRALRGANGYRNHGHGATGQKAEDGTAPPAPLGSELAVVLRRFFAEQRQAVIEQIHGKAKAASDDDVDEYGLPTQFIPLENWTPKLAKEVAPVIEVYMRQGGRAIASRIGASADVWSVVDRNLPKAAEKLSLNFAESTNATTSLQLDDALSKLRQDIKDGIVEGDTPTALKNRVQQVFQAADDTRAEMIARTEASRARHTAQTMTVQESGVKAKKMWLLSADACPECQAIAAEFPEGIELDKAFADTDYGPVDGPPLHPNCECSVIYRLEDGRNVQGD